MTPSERALICAPLLPTLPPGRRAAVRDTVPQVRGGRCRSNAARAKCAMHNGFHPPSASAARKRVDDALRRFARHTPRIVDAGLPRDPMSYRFMDSCGQPGSRDCWSERHARIVIAQGLVVPACPWRMAGFTLRHCVRHARFAAAPDGVTCQILSGSRRVAAARGTAARSPKRGSGSVVKRFGAALRAGREPLRPLRCPPFRALRGPPRRILPSSGTKCSGELPRSAVPKIAQRLLTRQGSYPALGILHPAIAVPGFHPYATIAIACGHSRCRAPRRRTVDADQFSGYSLLCISLSASWEWTNPCQLTQRAQSPPQPCLNRWPATSSTPCSGESPRFLPQAKEPVAQKSERPSPSGRAGRQRCNPHAYETIPILASRQLVGFRILQPGKTRHEPHSATCPTSPDTTAPAT